MTIPNSADAHNQAPFRYDRSTVRALKRAISPERFGTYLKLAAGDRHQALQLYARNAAVGAAFHGPLQSLEVTLRNAIDEAMAAAYRSFWFDSPVLMDAERKSIVRASESLRREGKPRTSGDVIATVSLGFWVALLNKRYDATLWRTVLHECFDPTPARARLHSQLDSLRRLRNRIAHHEPILERNLRKDHDHILHILGLLSPPTVRWVEHHSRVLEVLAQPSRRLANF